jgi:DNA polymerase
LHPILATFDFETRGDAGFVWVPPYVDGKLGHWESLPGFDTQKRGLSAVGVRVYIEHESFTPLMLAYDLTPQYGGATAVQWELGTSWACLQPLFDYIRAGKLLEAHNAAFEYQVWNYFCVPRWGWPELSIRQLRCSAVKSRAAGYPGKLADVTTVLDTPIKKDKDGDRLMKLFSIPRNPTNKDPRVYTKPIEAPDEWARYKAYNLTDIRSEHEVSIRVPDLPEDEQRRWFLDQEINDRGMAVDTFNIRNCIAVVEQTYSKFGAEFRGLTGSIEPTELKQLQGWLAAGGVHMYDMQAKTVDNVIERLTAETASNGGLVSPQLRALQIRQMLASASVKKLYALNAMTANDGRVHDMYLMHATHHGRTGGYGPQPANLYKGDWHEPADVDKALAVIGSRSLPAIEAAYPTLGPLDVVNNCLRSLFVAGPGKQLVSSDYSAIEDVVLAALAGEQWVLDVHHTHGMIYEAQIARMTGIPFEEFVKHRTDTGGVATYDRDGRLMSIKGGKHHPLRQQGKLAKLSGGYASWINGWKKFGADKYYRDDQEIKRAILDYRDTVPNTVELWGGQTRNKFNRAPDGSYAPEREELYGLEGAAIRAVKEPGKAFYGNAARTIVFQVGADDCLYMQLPSGRRIQYHTPRLSPATRQWASPWELALTYWGRNTNPEKGPPAWIQMDLYGGVLTQNATGGTARDIMMHGMENCAAEKLDIVMHTYDELVIEAKVCDNVTVQQVEGCMNDLPKYAKGWPIFAKNGWAGPRYGKWD